MPNQQELRKTNAMRILDTLGISYGITQYQWDEEHSDAVHAAASIGMDPLQVVKTIVMRTQDKRICVFCLPAPWEVSAKKAKILCESTSLELVRQEELRMLTGYVRGGCSPLGMIRKYPTFIEETLQLHDVVAVSAGLRGTQLLLSPADLARAVQARFADLT